MSYLVRGSRGVVEEEARIRGSGECVDYRTIRAPVAPPWMGYQLPLEYQIDCQSSVSYRELPLTDAAERCWLTMRS